MDPRALVRPLEARWRDALEDVLRPMKASFDDTARLAPKVVALSQAYNAAEAEGRHTKLPLDARIAFSFARDVPKGAAAVRELVASGALAMPASRPLRVLDLGAGLGAMTWGLVRALVANGAEGAVDAVLVDEDAEALSKAVAIARAASEPPITLSVTTRVESLSAAVARYQGAPADVVILGQVLSELDPRGVAAERVASQSALVARILATMVASDGSLVIVEPALRDRTRHLHALRDQAVLSGATVFAPCLHALGCPALATDGDWCHEDLAAVELPAFVAPLARAAGLRWQGLTFSYLVLRKDGQVAQPAVHGDRAVRFRVVSDLLRTKGKTEVFACGEDGKRPRIRRLDRDADADGPTFGELRRGDVVTMESPDGAPIDERGRVRANATIDVAAVRR